MEDVLPPQALHLENGCDAVVIGFGNRIEEMAAGHVEGERIEIELGRRSGGDDRAIAQHHDLLADLEDLDELVANEEHRHALGLEAEDGGQQRMHLALRQRRRRLVHDDQPGIERQRPGDRDELLVSDGKRFDARIEGDIHLDALEDGFGQRAHAAAVDQLVAGANFGAEGDVLGNRQIGEEREILEDDLDAARHRAARVEPGRLAVDEYLAGGGRFHARQNLDERGLTAAVFAR